MSPDSNCSRCGSSVAVGAKFCRRCGSAVEATDVGAGAPGPAGQAGKEPPSCPSCSAPTAAGASFCRSCGERLSPPASGSQDATPVSPPPPAPPRRERPAPPRAPAAPAGQADSRGRGPLFALAAVVVCLALAGLAGGGAYLLTREDAGGGEAELYEPALAPWEEGALPPVGAEDEFESELPGAESSSSTEAIAPAQERFEEARSVWRAHWEAIADGRYGEAYDLFHPGYEAERSGWVETHETEAARVSLDAVKVEPGATEPRADEYWLYVEVPLRDRGGPYAGDCRLFYGEVRMAESGGGLLYRPGVYRGREGSFGRSHLGGGIRDLPETSPRCP